MPNTADSNISHRAEVDAGERFEFGKNWRRFLSRLDDDRIKIAEESVSDFLVRNGQSLEGKRFLDIGCGSGLFSLAARRLGAEVVSFDYDGNSVGCTAELRRRYFPDDSRWRVMQGSVLDKPFVESLGMFDVVYSWGVLHHTGSMWEAIDNAMSRVADGGRLFIAIYNDCGDISDDWRDKKQKYNQLPRILQTLYALTIIVPHERETLKYFRGQKDKGWKGYLDYWRNYKSARGMSRWHDWIDWIGGYPYECASAEELVDYVEPKGYALTKIEDRSGGIGCHELVFQSLSGDADPIESITFGRQVARRSGGRMVGPFEPSSGGWIGGIRGGWTAVPGLSFPNGRQAVAFEDFRLIGKAVQFCDRGDGPLYQISPSDDADPNTNGRDYRIAVCHMKTLEGPFVKGAGHSYFVEIPSIAALADNAEEAPGKGSLILYEDGEQLKFPHAMHTEINDFGGGRFSHWGDHLIFSTPDNSDPNTNGRQYVITYADGDL